MRLDSGVILHLALLMMHAIVKVDNDVDRKVVRLRL